MLENISKLLSIKEHERGKVFSCMLFAFLIGIIQVLVLVSSLSLFLKNYAISILPYVYIASSIVTLISGEIFGFFQTRMRLTTLMEGVLVVVIGSLFISWGMLIFTTYQFIILVLIVWGWTVFGFCNLVVTNIINSLFSFEQGKRIYGMIASALAAGGIFAGLISPIIVHFIRTAHMIAVSAIVSGIALYGLYKIKKVYFYGKIKENTSETRLSKIKLSKIAPKNRKYIILIFLFSALSTFAYYLLDQWHYLKKQHAAYLHDLN